MKGVWLNQNKAIAALDTSLRKFEQLKISLYTKKKGKGNLYFIPLDSMTERYQTYYADQTEEYGEDAAEIEDILGDISGNNAQLPEDLQTALAQARLDNLQAKTRYTNERLEARKNELFEEWSTKFFEIFAKSFAKVKNYLIELHLNDEQIKILDEKIELAMETLENGLDQINADWMNEQEEEIKE